ncbi:MAG: hypothetical protein LJE56_07390 [Acidiferrobacterales bacterium]|jgi:hypothetical protein|nr:hypothetical protein [Acidiferrobacterales bacterium]
MRKILLIIAVVVSFSATADEPQETITTNLDLDSGRVLRMHWHWVYEGYKTVHKLEFLKAGTVTRSMTVTGQPIFNKSNTLVAIPNCWHGGCELTIEIVNLETEKKLPDIKVDKDAFLKLTWIADRRLKVLLRAPNPDEIDSTEYFDF